MEPRTNVVTIHRSGRYEVTIKTDRGTAWVRLAMASAVGLPKASSSSTPPAREESEPSTASEDRPIPFAYDVGWDKTALPITISGELSYAYEDLSEENDAPLSGYERVSLILRRAFPTAGLWLRETSYIRLREGPETLGTRVNATLAPEGSFPDVDLLGRIAYQSFDGKPALGWLASAALSEPFPISQAATLAPEIKMTFRHVDYEANHEAGADGEVFSVYAARRPRSLAVTLPLYHRPWTDMLNSMTLGATTLPELDGFDVLQAAAQTRVLAGSGIAPLVRLRVVSSYRLRSALRREAFLRNSVEPALTFWYWLTPMGRITLDADISYFIDYPQSAGAGSVISGMLTIGLDLVGGRGLQDFTPSEKPFAERMEEGGRAPSRLRRGLTPYWKGEE